MNKVVETQEENKVKGFDLMVTHRDPQTGVITKVDPYIARVIAAPDGGKTTIYERPKGSGNLWNKKGEPVGRWVVGKDGRGKQDKDAAHVAFVPPQTEDQIIRAEMTKDKSKIAELEREIASIKAEQEKKASATPAKKDQGA